MFLLSDNVDTLIGMRMAGVEGVVLHEEPELRAKLSELLERDDIADDLRAAQQVDDGQRLDLLEALGKQHRSFFHRRTSFFLCLV